MSMVMLWVGMRGPRETCSAELQAWDCGFPLSLLRRKAPKALETKLRDFNPVWRLREGEGREPGWQGGQATSRVSFSVDRWDAW